MIPAPSSFHEKAQGSLIKPVAMLYVSFNKQQDTGANLFVLDTSELDGIDRLGSDSTNPLQIWDTYSYIDFTDRLVSVSIERSIEFPYCTQSAMADFSLDNWDNYFSLSGNSPIKDYNVLGRPCKVYAGFETETILPQFVGLTSEMPDVRTASGIANYHAVDFLSAIAEQTLLSPVIERDVTTDVVLSEIVEQFGVLPNQYSFEKGDNVIPFVFFDIGQNAGEAIRKLVQAEGGKFWLDEQGILRFAKRYSLPTEPVAIIPETGIIEIEVNDNASLVNRVQIECDVREVQEYQSVYTKTGSSGAGASLWVVPANSSITRECRLSDPCYSVVSPTLGRNSTVSWFLAINSGEQLVSSGVVASGVLSTNAYTITFTNNNNFAVEITDIQLWGEPAKVYDHLSYDVSDSDSIEKYGEKVLTITDNQFLQNYEAARNLGIYTLRQYADYNGNIKIRCKGDFSWQLMDIVELTGQYAGYYMIDSIKWVLEPGLLETDIVMHKVDKVTYFTLDESVLNGTDVLA